MKLGELQPAYEALHHAHELNPQDAATADMLYATAFDLAQRSQEAQGYSDSLRYFEEAAALKPQEPGPHSHMADIYLAMGRPAEAEVERRKANQ
jgi:Flp pilus assembly protein TadD